MTLVLSMILVDQTVVSVALPTIQRELDVSQTGLQWVVNAYLLAIAAFVAVGGRIGDMFGNDRIFKVGAIVFIASSAVCGLAGSEAILLAARAGEGIGAAMMIPATGTMVINAFEPQERGRAMGVYAGVSMIFLAMGPLLGGVLTQDVSWRAVFWINVPIGIVMLVLAHVTVPRGTPIPGARIDWFGLFTIVPGLTALVLALMQSQEWGWGSAKTIGCLAAGALLLVVFVLGELRIDQPLIQLRLFRSHNFTADGLVLFCVELALIGLTVFGALWVQNVLGFDPHRGGPVAAAPDNPAAVHRADDRPGLRPDRSAGDRRRRLPARGRGARLGRRAAAPHLLRLARARLHRDGYRHRHRHGHEPDQYRRAQRRGAEGPRRGLGGHPDPPPDRGSVGLALMGTVVSSVQQDHINAFV